MSRWRNVLRRRWGAYTISGLVVLLLVLTGCSGGAVRHESWPGLVVFESTVYAANVEQVQAFNAETGKLYWSYPQEADKNMGPFYSTPIIVPEYGLLIVPGFKDRKVHAFSLGASPAERPDVAWTFPASNPALSDSPYRNGAGGQYVGSGVVAGNLFLIGNGDGYVYALNLENGAAEWAFQTQDRVWATPVVQGAVVYIASLDHHLYAVDLASGDELWQVEVAGAIAATPVFANGYLWVGDFAKALYRIDPETHSQEKVLATQGWVWASPIIAGDVLYLADASGYVYAFNIASQTLIRDNPAFVGDTVHSRPILNVAANLLFVAGYEKGAISTIDTEHGSILKWGVEQANPGRLPGDLVADGARLYAMPTWGQERVQAYDMDSGSLLWVYPPEVEK